MRRRSTELEAPRFAPEVPAAVTASPAAPVAAMPAAAPVEAAVDPSAPASRRAARAQRLATGEQPVISDAAHSVVGDAEPVFVDEERESLPSVEVVEVSDPASEPEHFAPLAEAVAPQAMEPVRRSTEAFELIEPTADTAPEEMPAAPAAQPEASDVDEFAAAARLFSFTGELPAQTATGEPEAPAEESARPTPHVAPRRSRGAAFKRAAATTFSIGIVGVVGLLTVGMTTPAQAVAAINGTVAGAALTTGADIVAPSGESLEIDPDEIQAYVAPAEIQSAALDRPESYATASLADLASELGITHPSNFYVNDPNAAIQWPFAVGVGISWGFVWRDGRQHQGADFTPGEGAHVQAIADGTVRIATENGGGFGVTVLIDHIIDGQLVSSRYAHMLVGSLQVSAGQQVKVGQFLGRTGNTGHSFGAHTHFEILANGTTPIDPIAWLRSHAGRDSLG